MTGPDERRVPGRLIVYRCYEHGTLMHSGLVDRCCPVCDVEAVGVAYRLESEHDRKVAELREALKFYAERRNYGWEVAYGGGENAEPGEGVGSRWTVDAPVAEDGGACARGVLARSSSGGGR